jgi:hypothetical protein
MAGTPFDSDRSFQDAQRNGAKKISNGYSDMPSMQPKPCGHCETCRRPIASDAPGGYCYDCYRTMEFLSKDSTGGAQPGAGAQVPFVTPKIAPGA